MKCSFALSSFDIATQGPSHHVSLLFPADLLGSPPPAPSAKSSTPTPPTPASLRAPLLGNSVFCCSGMCLDGTHIGDPGQCENWLDLCGDVDTPPSCLYNQVLSYGDPPTVDSGDGCCGACCCECQYQRNNWSWDCCDCPLGFVAVDVGRCDATANPACVGCQEPDQVLHYDADTGYSCTISSSSSSSSTPTSTSTMSDTSATSNTAITSATTSDATTQTQTTSDASTNSGTTSASATQTTSQSNTASATTSAPTGKHTPTLCEDLQSAADQMNKISSYSTWLGALCGTTNTLSAAINYIEDGYAIAKAHYDRGKGGVFGNSFGAASSVLATITAFTIGGLIIVNAPEEAAVASILELAYEGACAIDTVVGIATTLEGREISQDLAKNNCPPAISKRFLTSSNVLDGNIPRSQDYNPCAELLAFYPTDYSVPGKLKSVCDQVIADPTSLTLIPQVTKTCQDYENSGNSTILINFANMLQALQTFEPYCTENSVLFSTTSSQTTSSTSSSLKSQSVILSSKTSPENCGSSTVSNYYGGSPSPSPYYSGSPSPNPPQQSYTASPPNNPPNPPYSPNLPNNPVPSSQNPQVLPTPSPYIASSPSQSNEPASSTDAVGAPPSPQSPYNTAASPSPSPSPAETPDISPSPAAPIPAAATSPNEISSGQVLASSVPTSPADTSAVSVDESETAAGSMSSGSSTLSSSNTSNGSTESPTYVPASSATESSPLTMLFGTFMAGLAIVGVMMVMI